MAHSEDVVVRLSPARKALLEHWKRGKDVSAVDRQQIFPREEQERAPLSFAQQRLWFLDQLEPDHPFYNIHTAFRLDGSLQMKLLQQSLNRLVERHESLRTTFRVENEQPVQVISPGGSCEMVVISLITLSSEGRREQLPRLVQAEARKPFDLERGPLLRATLVRVDGDEHVLLITMHHIISDGWSIGVFMRELATYYNAFVADSPALLPDLPIQYADYTLWQRQSFRGDIVEKQKRYWQKKLAAVPATLELPLDHPRPAIRHYQGKLLPFQLPLKLSEALQYFSQREGVTLFMTLLAAFKALLVRYSGQHDIVLGTDVTERNTVETEGLIGFFVNTLMLRTNLSGNPTFRELLVRVREVVLEAFSHRDMPFDVLVADLRPDRALNQPALVQVMFDLQDTQVTDIPFTDLSLKPLFVDGGTAKFDLVIDIFMNEQGLSGSIEYSTDLFEEETIGHLLRHWQVLLESVVTNPEQRIAELPLLTAEERQKILVEWNSITANYPTQSSVQALFEQQAMCTPERIAVTHPDGHLTYAALNEYANQIAHYLRSLGVGPEVLVGIYLERSLEMLIVILAVFKSGGAYVPLDPAYPKERLEFVLGETRTPVVLTTSAWSSSLPSSASRIVRLDVIWQTLTQYSKQKPPDLSDRRNLAYVIYTSGSTGSPKGAMLTQEGMVNHLYAKIDVLAMNAKDRVAQTASLCFDISVWQFLAALLLGGQVCILSDEVAYNSQYLFQQIIAEDISIVELVPAQLRLLLDELDGMDEERNQLMQLRWFISTGEAVSPVLCRRWLQKYPRTPLMNTYGATECSDDVAHAAIECLPPEQETNVPVGRAIANMQAYVLDSSLEPVPVGMTGQIYLAGVGVGRGYLHDPTRTAAAFLPDPYSREVGGRLYKTGDIGRYLADGQIECLGREDSQVKVRGHRVELGEIEVLLEQHPAVREGVVIDRGRLPEEKQLVAYVVPREEMHPSTKALREYLQGKLPDYMVPSYFIFLEMLPLNPNGKVDRRVLAVPDQFMPEREAAFVAPHTKAQEVIADLWHEFLGLDHIGVHDNFFALGGHSLLVTQVVLRMQRIFQVEFPLRRFFEAPTIDGLVNELAHMKGGREIVEEIALIFKEVEHLSEEEMMELSE